MKNFRKAFSFIEVILVLVILGLIAAVFVPATVKIRQTARENAITANVANIIRAGQRYNLEKSVKSVDYKTLIDAKYIEPIQPVVGESYDKVQVDTAGGKVVVETPMGEKVERDY